MRVEDLLSLGSLDIQIAAGVNGVRNEVLWAHSCELDDPTSSLGPNELLMTNGYCIPYGGQAQVKFLRSLVKAELSGIMVPGHPPMRPLSAEFLAEADRLSFPVLLAGPNTLYAIVARQVAAANWSSQANEIFQLSKLYNVATQADPDIRSVLAQIVPILRAGVRVEDSLSGLPLGEAEHGDVDAALSVRRFELGGDFRPLLTLYEYPGEQVSGFILMHLRKILQIAADGPLRASERRAELSEGLLLSLLNGAVPADVREVLPPEVPREGFKLAVFSRQERRAVARATALSQLPVVVGADRAHCLALVPVTAVSGFKGLLAGLGVRAGVSSTFTDFLDTRIAAAEAARVFETSEHGNRLWTEFEGSSLSVLTRSHKEAQEIITGVLGSLSGDTPKKTVLRETLFAYLRLDRQWDTVAAELNIHRQTLAYRMKRIAEETGRSLTRTEDLSAFWIASEAWRSLHPDSGNDAAGVRVQGS